MLNQINLADIRAFVLIAQLGNFTKAADALAVSRSHVSRQISALEAQMGVTLLTRTTRSMTLTPAGAQFYQQCETALKAIDQALVAAVDDTHAVRGLIRVNCVGGHIGEEIIARYVVDFMALHPQISVHLDFSSHRVDLIEDAFDVAFRMGELADAGFIARKLMDIKIATLASPDYLARYGTPTHPKALSSHRCLTGSVTRWTFQSMQQESTGVDVQLDGQLSCKNGHTLVRGALAGTGIIRVPRIYCEDAILSGDLVPLLPQWQIPDVPFSVIYHRDRYQPARLRSFIDYIHQRFSEDYPAAH